jgi:hypothetical protein
MPLRLDINCVSIIRELTTIYHALAEWFPDSCSTFYLRTKSFSKKQLARGLFRNQYSSSIRSKVSFWDQSTAVGHRRMVRVCSITRRTPKRILPLTHVLHPFTASSPVFPTSHLLLFSFFLIIIYISNGRLKYYPLTFSD